MDNPNLPATWFLSIPSGHLRGDHRGFATTVISELLYADLDRQFNEFRTSLRSITIEGWTNFCNELSFLVCNYVLTRSLSNGELGMLLQGASDLDSDLAAYHEDLGDLTDWPRLKEFFFDGYSVFGLLNYFQGISPLPDKVKNSGLNEVVNHLESSIEILEEYIHVDTDNDRVSGHKDLLAAFTSIDASIVRIHNCIREDI